MQARAACCQVVRLHQRALLSALFHPTHATSGLPGTPLLDLEAWISTLHRVRRATLATVQALGRPRVEERCRLTSPVVHRRLLRVPRSRVARVIRPGCVTQRMLARLEIPVWMGWLRLKVALTGLAIPAALPLASCLRTTGAGAPANAAMPLPVEPWSIVPAASYVTNMAVAGQGKLSGLVLHNQMLDSTIRTYLSSRHRVVNAILPTQYQVRVFRRFAHGSYILDHLTCATAVNWSRRHKKS